MKRTYYQSSNIDIIVNSNNKEDARNPYKLTVWPKNSQVIIRKFSNKKEAIDAFKEEHGSTKMLIDFSVKPLKFLGYEFVL